MKKCLWIALGIAASLLATQSSAATIKVGDKCTKVNQTRKVGTKVFICSNKKVWLQQKVLPAPKVTATPAATNQAEISNPVIARIKSLLIGLPVPKTATAPNVDWIYPADSNLNRIQILRQQHQLLSNYYQDLYRWNGIAVGIIDTNPSSIIEKLVAAKCSEGYIQSVRRLEADPSLMGAGTSYCGGQLFAYFLDRNMSDHRWNNILGSEFGGIIQDSVARSHKFKDFPNSSPYSAAPNWYAEGGQNLLPVIAEGAATKVWNFDLRLHEGMRGDWCMNDTLEVNRCSDVIGTAAVELAVALYGMDAPLILFKYLEPDINQKSLFESGFPDSFAQFNEWSVAYLKYLRYGTTLPTSLLSRLKT